MDLTNLQKKQSNSKAVILARVSSPDQEATGYSLPAQEKMLHEYAERQGFVVVKVFLIAESARGMKEREIFKSMMDFVRKENIDVMIFEKVDRYTRNLKDSVVAYDWIEGNPERQIHSVKDSLVLHKNCRSQEKLNWDIRVAIAKNYVDNLSEEVKKGQREKVAQGWLPTKPPLGYKTIGESGHKIHVIDDTIAPLIKKMFELYTTGTYSLEKLVEKMYEEGLRTRQNCKLVKSRLDDLLTDPFYFGKMRWNGDVYAGKHQPLITKELFDKVQSILNGNTTPKYGKHFFLFKGLIKCSECSGTITWERQKRIIYGHCNHYRNCSKKRWAKEQDVEEQLVDKFTGLQIKSPRLAEWLRNALKESHKEQIDYSSKTLNELQKRYEQIEKGLQRLYDDYIFERITKEFYDTKFKQYTAEKEGIVQSIQEHSQAGTKYYELGVNIYELAQKSKEIYLNATDEEKRQLLKLVFSGLVLDEGRLTATYSKPFQILYEAVRSTNGSKMPKFEKMPIRIFEPIKTPGISIRNDIPGAVCPNWLPG